MRDRSTSSPRRRIVVAAVIGGMIGASVAPGVGLAAKFLTQQKADRTYVRHMSASRGGSGTIFAGATPQFNTTQIEATTSGFLLIQGSAHFDNDGSPGQDRAELTYQVDAAAPVFGGGATLGPDDSANTIDPGETAQVAYVDVVRVDKGTHTVRQLVSATEGGSGGGPPGSGLNVRYRAATLVVTFFPRRGATLQ